MIAQPSPKAGLETLYAALLILRRNSHSLQSMPCLKAFLIPAESCIFKWSGYRFIVIPSSAKKP